MRRGEWASFRLPAGANVRVSTLQPHQAVEVIAYMLDDPTDRLSTTLTTLVEYAHTLRAEMRVWTQNGRPLLRVLDQSGDKHDLQLEACNRDLIRALGLETPASCLDNFRAALHPLGLADKWIPYPIGLFRQCGELEGRFQMLPASSRSGDHVSFRTENPIFLVASACPLSGSAAVQFASVRVEVSDHE
jgi:uncharacterized protein YcgI (DUF1989 family)